MTHLLRPAVALLFVASLYPKGGLATTEIPALHDARVIALGGAATGYIDSPSAVLHNPAALDRIEGLSISLGVFPFRSINTVPLEGPNTEKSSSGGFFPMFFAGAAYRITDRIVAGIGLYPTGGIGGAYENVSLVGGQDLDFVAVFMEGSLPVSFRITERLSIAAGLRVTYLRMNTKGVDPTGGVVEQDLSGINFAGGTFGVSAKLLDNLDLGFNYRTKVTTKATGTTISQGQELDTRTNFASPHSFRIGGALRLFEDRLMLAADAKYMLFGESNESIRVTTTTPMGDSVAETSLDWKNSLSGHFGGEFRFAPVWLGRLGFSVANSATPEDTASPFATVPGMIYTVSAGAGLALEHWDVDAGAYYTFTSGSDATPTVAGSFPGNYSMNSLMFGLSGEWRP